MILVTVLCLLLVSACVMLHYETLRLLNDRLARTTIVFPRAKVLVAFTGAVGSHVAQIAAFAFAYYVLQDRFGIGGLGGTIDDSFSTFVYFSSETYTTLGFGDIFPIGQLRVICGIEALLGLLMIGWTTSFTYLEMRRYW
jgi:hypothetical protein